MKYFLKKMPSPVGELRLISNEKALVAILWENDDPERILFSDLQLHKNLSILCETEKQLKEYFKGNRVHFDLELQPSGTSFQEKVWKALREIPYGETRSYLQVARRVGSPKACRAVGAANGRNPISIIVPCHRVIGANGKLTGFAGGLKAKRLLLDLEKSTGNNYRH